VSKNLEKVVQRAISDAGFRRQLQSNPDAALRGFQLTTDEVAALKSGDATRLMSFGIDQRMSKTFSFSDVTMAHQSATTDLSSGARSSSLTESDTAGATHGSVSVDDTSGATRGALTDQDASAASRLIIPNANAGQNAIDPGQVDGQVGANIGDPTSSSETVRSSVRDVEPTLLGANSASDAVEDTSHAFAARAGMDGETVRSSVRDVEPATLQGSGLVAPTEGSPESFAFSEPEAIRSSVRDVEPTLLGANSASDAVEDTSHAFLAQQDVNRYAAESGINTGVATDEGQVFNPGAETLTDSHTDTVGSAGSSQEPDLSA
jgi:hypothetical protein